MPITSGRMAVGKYSSPNIVIADSIFELEIKDVKEIQGGKAIVTDKILLMDLSGAVWSIKVFRESGYEYFYAEFYDFPKDLLPKSHAILSVLCGEKVVADYYSGSLCESKIILRSGDLSQYYVNSAITLKFLLVITCEGVSDVRKTFYDPQANRNIILSGVANLFGDPTFSDFTFIIGGLEVKVHMNILAAASPVMKRMFTTDLKEAKTKKCTIDAISPETFDDMLRFIYRSELPDDLKAVARPLYEAAHYYEIENLKEICAQEIHTALSKDNALEIFEWAQNYGLEDLKMDAWKILKRDILKIFVQLNHEPLPLKKIYAIIEHREQNLKFWKDLQEDV